MIKRLLFLCLLSCANAGNAQNLLLNTPESFDGYTLFCPNNGFVTYLINNCGEVVNSWTSEYRPGMVVYMLPNGQMLHTCNVQSSFQSGGTGGRLELFNWDGTLDWAYDFWEDESYCQHHDVEFLPNGNILILAWEAFDAETSTIEGFANDLIRWSEMIVEVNPNAEGNPIVWEWHVWDHLVVANPELHPELVWVDCGNQGVPGGGPDGNTFHVDWLHGNAVDYNAELDQIAISMRATDEVWIIDHSTTTAEAASHEGGNSGAGGDLLYRWGNPESYGLGGGDEQTLYGQHDIQWIAEGMEGAGSLMVFNNGGTRGWSSVDVWTPPSDGAGNYTMNPGEITGPDVLDWTYFADTPADFFSANISGATRQPNGNTLICEGAEGHLFEVTSDGDVVWEFDHPNGIFRTYRYAPGFAGFEGLDLTPVGSIDPTPEPCALFTGIEGVHLDDLLLFPNPASTWMTLSGVTGLEGAIVRTLSGQEVLQSQGPEIFVGDLPAGIYLVEVLLDRGRFVQRVLVE